MKLRIGIVLAAVVAAVLPAPASADEPDTGTAVVEAEVAAEILQKGESTFWIVLDAEADLSPAYGLPWSERGDERDVGARGDRGEGGGVARDAHGVDDPIRLRIVAAGPKLCEQAGLGPVSYTHLRAHET